MRTSQIEITVLDVIEGNRKAEKGTIEVKGMREGGGGERHRGRKRTKQR